MTFRWWTDYVPLIVVFVWILSLLKTMSSLTLSDKTFWIRACTTHLMDETTHEEINHYLRTLSSDTSLSSRKLETSICCCLHHRPTSLTVIRPSWSTSRSLHSNWSRIRQISELYIGMEIYREYKVSIF